MRKTLLPMVSLCALSACMVGPKYHAPKPWSPSHYDTHARENGKTSPQSVVTELPFDDEWWKSFKDPELASLEERIATQNLDLQLATANLAQSRAEMMIAGAERFPMLSAQGTYARAQNSSRQLRRIIRRISKKTGGMAEVPRDATIPLLNQWDYSIDATYEVDLWGRVARQYQASKALMEMTEEERRSVLIAQQADMARDYLQLRGDQKRMRVLTASHKTLSDLLDLTQNRYKSGLVTELDVDSVQSRLHQVDAQMAQLSQSVAQEKNAIAYLLGAPPKSLEQELEKGQDIPVVPPFVPAGLPSELAHRRPDVREAEARLRETVAEVGEATADFYPKVTINADFGFQTLSFKDLGFWGSRAWNVGPSVSLPIFQGGRLTGQLKLKKAAQKAAAISYRQTVLKSWHEVDNVLQNYHDEQNRRQGLYQSVHDSQRSFDLALNQYRSGLSTYLDVLNAQIQVQQGQMDLASSDAKVAVDLARLYNALGGGWQEDLPDETQSGQSPRQMLAEAVQTAPAH
ncbi:efflux transporter outer membrane subunit [Acetobacteraceae bacterium ESL0697]|nr:efflux transporter outer membrane subunit [Acetobacteraceae bacterium ESL0697]